MASTVPSNSTIGRALMLAAVLVVAVVFIAPISWWPWDHDEVHSLMELGLVPLGRYPGPVGQLERMHHLVPVWWLLQRSALSVLPLNEWGTRLLPATCGALLVLFVFRAGTRARGAWFGWSLLILCGGSQALVWLSQQGRFYPSALLFMTLALASVWSPDRRFRFDVVTVLLTLAAVLSHNLTLVVFCLAAVSVVVLRLVTTVPATAVRRALLAGVTAAATYVLYLRPLLTGWVAGDTGGTPPIVSFVAQIGVATLALAAVGAVAALEDAGEAFLRWCALLLVLCLVFVGAVPWILRAWNPRYALFFMLPAWVMGAAGAAAIARRLPTRRAAVAWLFAVLLLQMPKLASHFVDGSRHDFRTAATVVADVAPGDPVFSNWPETLQYYLQPKTGQQASYWAPRQPLPPGEAVVVMASNAWEPVLQVPHRQVRVAGEIGHRRFDEQSHLIRVYVVSVAQ